MHVHNAHGQAEDEEGVEVSNLPAAREIAITGIRDLLASEARNGAINLAGRLDVSDEAGKVLVSIPFADAVRIEGAG